MEYIKTTNGLEDEAEYPFAGVDTSCSYTAAADASKVFDPLSTYYKVPYGNQGLMGAIDQAPVSVCLDATNWDSYQSGVFSNCGTQLDHCVTAVGYTQDYWIIRNSWGTTWGEDGYIQLAMGNTCNLMANAYMVQLP